MTGIRLGNMVVLALASYLQSFYITGSLFIFRRPG